MSFSNWRQRLGRFRFTIVVTVLAVLCAWGGYEIGNARLKFLEQERERLENRITRLQGTIEDLEYQTNILKVERDVDRVAIENLQGELRSAQDHTSEVRRELSFYQRVMAPELDADGVKIDSLQITADGGDVFRFRLILVQLDRAQQQLAQGSYSITLRGRRNGRGVEYNVLELAELAEGTGSFAMNYFTRVNGSFKMPEGLSPETVQVNVRTRGGQRTSQQYNWNDLANAGVAMQGESN
ncbi:DUF6776 family protein [Aliidiomarina soli]|uniref:Uncharacterized protein n=1 Tax=Aliidiomarina soli TaxID=1928574 RepID=A0A432WDT0_9GAMM|nr:DUF6776 family protein [Aliidiomarina soli]RUO31034.1 hypothetical protein CWE14_11045 [Aliidiomarina soli]